jgi:hypothetical protein
MKFDPLSPLDSRRSFEGRVFYAEAILKEGKMKFASGLRAVEDLMKIRLLPNERVNLLTIGGMARTVLQTPRSLQIK